MSNTDPRIVIVGVDGATWDRILPWAAEGHLPCFARLLQIGASGPLESTKPPVTAPAWSSMMTGRNPGKHGLFDFIAHKKDSYGVTYTFGGQRKSPTIWKMLSQRGYRVGAVNIPMTYPPEKVNGYMISGMDTPDDSPSVAGWFTKEQLQSEVGSLKLDIRHFGSMNNDNKRLAVLDELIELEEKRLELIQYLQKKYPVDVLMFVINEVDQVQHHFWQYMDPTHPRYDAQGAAKFSDAILRIYRHVDSMIQRVVETWGESTQFLIVSDHGFGPSSNKVVQINKALRDGGFLAFKQRPAAYSGYLQKVEQLLRSNLPGSAKQKIASMFPWARERLESMVSLSLVDWSKTTAYCFEVSTTSPNVWINLKGKRPKGIVGAGDYRRVVKEVKQYLLDITEPETGQRVFPNVYERDEIIWGGAAETAPDLILSWWEDGGFTPAPSIEAGRVAEGPIVRRIHEPIADGREWGGTHQLDGIVLTCGPRSAPTKDLVGAKLLDIAPTVFSILGERPDPDFDGRSLLDTEDLSQAAGPEEAATQEDPSDTENVELSEDELNKISERLKSLGYL